MPDVELLILGDASTRESVIGSGPIGCRYVPDIGLRIGTPSRDTYLPLIGVHDTGCIAEVDTGVVVEVLDDLVRVPGFGMGLGGVLQDGNVSFHLILTVDREISDDGNPGQQDYDRTSNETMDQLRFRSRHVYQWTIR